MKLKNKFDNWIENPKIFCRGYLVGLCVGCSATAILFLVLLYFI